MRFLRNKPIWKVNMSMLSHLSLPQVMMADVPNKTVSRFEDRCALWPTPPPSAKLAYSRMPNYSSTPVSLRVWHVFTFPVRTHALAIHPLRVNNRNSIYLCNRLPPRLQTTVATLTHHASLGRFIYSTRRSKYSQHAPSLNTSGRRAPGMRL